MKTPATLAASFAASILSLGITATSFAEIPGWQSQTVTTDFYAEAAAAADFNGDGKIDIAYGPFWYAGPDFKKANRFAEGEAFDGSKGYSDNFFAFSLDADKDGSNDILVYGFPGKEARLYLNPGNGSGLWKMVIVANEISNESPTFVDIIPGGHPEIVCSAGEAYGYYQAGEDATKPWTWHQVTPKGSAGGRFEHGLGVGDVNGDGRLDIVQKQFWFEQPAEASNDWKKHGWNPVPGPGGAQILVHDFDGDGDNDLVSSLAAHAYGLAWFEQTAPGKFARRDIMGESSTDNPYGVCFSQLHALTLVDIDDDGRKDFVTGKRYFAHNGKDPGGLEEPVLYWFRNTGSGESIEFVPHLVDRDSGVGVDVLSTDLNGDKKPDIITSSKKGLYVHLQAEAETAALPERWKVPGGRPQDDYGHGLTPEESVAAMEVPEGFAVDLIAAEPDVTQPIAMCFDARGRIWVLEGHNYPEKAPEGEGKDRIIIFEDTDADGSFESRKVFYEGLNLASGMEIGFGGVFVGAAPELLFIPDRDGDDQPDGEPEVLLDGWGLEDTHETLNAFTWGPDGWLYGCHGVFTHSKVGKPGTPDEERIPLNAALWRYHPTGGTFEVWSHGTSNPWGADFDEYGEWFISSCVIPHFFHLSQGGRYHRQGGQHFNPWTFDDIKTIADHAHYVGSIKEHAFWGDNKKLKPMAPSDTSALGGGHAHCGLAIYDAPEFPEQYRGEAFFHNLHGHRVVRERLERKGSSYVARHRPDFTLTNNSENIGVGIMQGPDGALYFSDWVDEQTCHHRDVEIWDRSNGRIYRIRYGDVKSPTTDLPSLSDAKLVAQLKSENSFIARQAQRLLQERAAAETLNKEATNKALAKLKKEVGNNTPLNLRILWTRHVTGLLTGKQVMAALSHPDEHIRGWAVQLALPNEATKAVFEELAGSDNSLVVRRQLASKLQALPLEDRWSLAEKLISHHQSQFDPNIPYLCWYGIEPLFESDISRALTLTNKTKWPQMKDFLNRRGIVTPEGRVKVMTTLSQSKNPTEFISQAEQLLKSLSELPPVDAPANWQKAKAAGKALKSSPKLANVLRRLGVRFGDAEYFPHWRKIASNSEAPATKRAEAIELLTIGEDPELAPIARESLTIPGLRVAAIAALRKHPGDETAQAIIASLDSFPLKQRNEAINLLASRPAMALPLLKAVDSGVLQASLISPVMLDQFERFENEEIQALIEANWTRGGGAVDIAELTKSIEEWKKKLTPKLIMKADVNKGRQVYDMTCGTCHKMFGKGIELGPDLTGSNRADLAYILENVLAPSAVVGKDYMLNVFTLKDGSIVSGMVKEETPEFIKVSMPGGSLIDVKVSEVAKRDEIAQSLMPAGLFDALPLEQVADLVKYLESPIQVPLPGEEKKDTPSETKQPDSKPAKDTPPVTEGTMSFEADALVAAATSKSGRLKSQVMKKFGSSWSQDSQLWWTGATPGDVLTLKLEGIEPGTHDLVLYPTRARDYGTIKVTVNGDLQEVDLFSPKVVPGEPLRFKNINLSPTESLQVDIHVTGANPKAVPRHSVGIDRIEIQKAKAKAARSSKPNVVIIFCDDLGYGDLGCYGSPVIRTPHLDKMASEGLRFTDFYVAASVCTPSRAALLTGRYPIRSGMCSDARRVLFPDDQGGLPNDEITIAEGLKGAGYATMHVGKWHLGIHEGSRPTDQGFDHSFGIPYSNDMDPQDGTKHREHAGSQDPPAEGWNVPLLRDNEIVERPAVQTTLTKRYTEESVKFIQEQKKAETPFFLYLAHTMPHVPLFASSDFHGKSPAGRYGDVVEELDWSTGEILNTLRKLGIAEDTLVFFTSDNGPWLVMNDEGGSAGPLRDGKGSTWEGGMRVPAIAWWPGTIKPGRTSIVASALDLFPTSLALGGAELPKDVFVDGRDISPFLIDGKLPPRKPFFFYRGRELFACRLGPWKAHMKTRPAYEKIQAESHDPPLLFHLTRDPSEKRIRPGNNVGAKALGDIQVAIERHRKSLEAKPPQF